MDSGTPVINDEVVMSVAKHIRDCMTGDDCETCDYYKYDDYCTWELMRDVLLWLEDALYGDNNEYGEVDGAKTGDRRDDTP